MTKPATIADLSNPHPFFDDYRLSEIGTIDVGELLDRTGPLEAWAAFAKAIEKSGGKVATTYSGSTSVRVSVAPDENRQQDNLRRAQAHWAELERIYDTCVANATEPEDWRKDDLLRWIDLEGVSVPWETSAAAA
ncbi:hypothetical protein E3_0950 [Rhodococcus phage E3]|uniref:hypothetical protein n=1 Tax=Rhodococcus phage E3 TaxID=1007869 RepID=UPI0002C69718|nr:hypothetical protein M176_gp100 [Rhodococcus phage E3]AEQ21009.1 hypothetical protein E3_0950 [Rhodococcus phage E3]